MIFEHNKTEVFSQTDVTRNLKPKLRVKKECVNQRKKIKFLENGN